MLGQQFKTLSTEINKKYGFISSSEISYGNLNILECLKEFLAELLYNYWNSFFVCVCGRQRHACLHSLQCMAVAFAKFDSTWT